MLQLKSDSELLSVPQYHKTAAKLRPTNEKNKDIVRLYAKNLYLGAHS